MYRYVRGLERRVVQLEEQLGIRPSSSADENNLPPSTNTSGSQAQFNFNDPIKVEGGAQLSRQDGDGIIQTMNGGDVRPEQRARRVAGGQQEASPLASELKQLSLEATAERYLGSSSGVSFARLTQAVLKRLKSDEYPFAFEAASKEGTPPDPLVQSHGNGTHTPASALQQELISSADLKYPACLPAQEQAFRLVEYYWSHNHSLYPFVRKKWFMDCMRLMYTNPSDPSLQSHSFLFTLWMVFAIGSTAWSTINLVGENESVQYFNRAMLYFEGALSHGSIAALDALLLQVSYSFFSKVGSNAWYITRAAISIALGIGLHTKPTPAVEQLPVDVQEYRKRLFYCLYMMDRVVSIALGRPFGIRDEDVEVETFADVDEENILPHTIRQQQPMKTSDMAVPLHILRLRKIAGEIFDQVYSNRNKNLNVSEREEILTTLHEKLVGWRKNMPWPLPESGALRIPHFSDLWSNLNYYNHVIMIFRPSPLCPVLNVEKVGFIAHASAMSIRQVAAMQQQGQFAWNWLNLFSVFTATLTLVYSITAQPDALSTYLNRSGALVDLETASDLLEIFGRKFPSALKCRDIIQDVSNRLRAHTASEPSDPSRMQTILPSFTSIREDRSILSPSNEPGVSYPSFPTGNASYDDLQDRVRGVEYPSPSDNNSAGFSPRYPASLTSDSGLPMNFHIPPTPSPFGNVTAQFISAGLGNGTNLDLDEDFLNLLGGNFDTG